MPGPHDQFIILASNSPRRAALLVDAGYRVVIVAPDPEAEDGRRPGEPAASLVARLAIAKARNVAQKIQRNNGVVVTANESDLPKWILAADTVAECDGIVLGKPLDRDDARQMLRFLAGKKHRVWTGVCLRKFPGNRQQVEVDVTELQMNSLSEQELDAYLETGKWQGKAGSFGYQDGNDWVQIVTGSSSNVVGLPLELLARMLDGFDTN